MTFTALALGVFAFVAVIAVATLVRRMRQMATHVGPHSTHTDSGAGHWPSTIYAGDSSGDSSGNDCSSDAGGGDSGGGDCGGGDGGGGGGSD
jgi:hypothetical protein